MMSKNLWYTIRKKAPVRKSIGFAKQIPRGVKRIVTKPKDFARHPPVIANSFPKSGTNLLLQIVEVLPNIYSYGSVIASTPTLTYKEKSQKTHLNSIQRIVPGELVFAHLFYDPSYQEVLHRRCSIQFFIYRDLRDVAVSEAYYLTHMNPWHRLHKYFAKSLSTMEERISTTILGISDADFPCHYPDIAQRFKRYQGWLKQPDVFTLRFEDVVSGHQEMFRKIVDFYCKNSGLQLDVDEVVQRIVKNIDPSKSPTFREGQAGSWREHLTPKHQADMKAVAGPLLVELGYESDLNW